MSMFDYIRFKVPMPDGFICENFQTKDLECDMAVYEVDESGQLFRIAAGPGWPPLAAPEKQNFSGELNLTYYNHEGGYSFDKWREYDATFACGKLIEIVKNC